MSASPPTSQRAASPGRSIHLETFGCQMNELDSELVRSHLSALGYRFIADPNEADIILYNTCSVREQAENKVRSRVGIVGLDKKENQRRVILGVIGCMAEREGPAMIRKYPQIDLMCGPGELDKLPMLLENVLTNERLEMADRVALQGSNSRRSSTLTAAEDNLELLDLSRAFDPNGAPAGGKSAYVRITRGCNKFCTYCVVPNTRGPEVHRPPQAIIDECKRLADAGVIEVTLLGQTVNHYIYTHGAAVSPDGREAPQVGPGLSAFQNVQTSKRPNVQRGQRPLAAADHAARGFEADIQQSLADKSGHLDVWTFGRLDVSSRTTTFADLLHRIHEEVPQIQRLRFVTSFPLHFGDDILHVMRDCPRICRYLHVPAQSGSNRILKLMNRGYTREEYLAFIDRVTDILPEAEIAGDIIVGFPTETEEDFEQTKDLLRRVPFKNNFIFKYSPRPGTVAIKRFEDDVPEHVKRRRNNELLGLQSEISAQVHAKYVGRVVEVFVEQVSGRSMSKVSADAKQGVALTISAASHPATGEPPDASGPPTSPTVQLSGRTSGDLIAVFDAPQKNADQFIGHLLPVRITGSGPLLLRGEACFGQKGGF